MGTKKTTGKKATVKKKRSRDLDATARSLKVRGGAGKGFSPMPILPQRSTKPSAAVLKPDTVLG